MFDLLLPAEDAHDKQRSPPFGHQWREEESRIQMTPNITGFL